MPIHKKIDREFFRKWSSPMAYVVGFFAADGAMICNNRRAHFIEFHTTDKEIIIKIRKTLSSNHKISIRDRKNINHKIGYRLQIGSKEIFADLSRYGFTQNKSLSLRLPRIPRAFLGDFVRGYFDGDGNLF